VVVAVGGDGTVNEVARSLVHTETALGILPSGSGNGLARHLCIPMETDKALAIINNCQIEAFDYGIINDLPFFCTCGMGFDAFISLKFAEAGKRGPITYVENVLKEGLQYKPETYVVEDETGTHRHKAFLIACANAAQYGNNAYIAPGASMKDGLMDVIIMEPFNAFDAPTIAYDMFSKTLNQNSKIKTFRAKHIHIHRSSPGAIHYDGDPILTGTDIDVEMQPLGLRVVVNPDAIEDDAQPNPMLNAFSDLFNNINNVREDIARGGRRIHIINKLMLRRLSRL
jgi:YegS/Rv2252/BmrU family lipid kinase